MEFREKNKRELTINYLRPCSPMAKMHPWRGWDPSSILGRAIFIFYRLTLKTQILYWKYENP